MRKDFNVCVFCGSNAGKDAVYRQEAEKLARGLLECEMGLVYGGASVGIMGVLADTMLERNGCVIGVIPQALMDKEVAHGGLSDLRVVKTMHERKKTMYDLSEAFVTFPGGFGTLDETFEILTWKQIGIHQKPLIVLNIQNYFDPLIQFVDSAVSAGFIKQEHRGLFMTASTVEEGLQILSGLRAKS